MALGVALAWTATTHAQSTYAGAWQAGATSMDVAVESWGKDCGPRPTASRSAGGGTVQIEQQGQTLVIKGARDVRTDQCWSPNPAMRRTSSSYLSGSWSVHCKTAAQDPREETGVYTLKALAEDHLLYQDLSRFNWKLKDSTCTASITTTQTLMKRAAPAPLPPAPPSLPSSLTTVPLAPTCKPGAPQRLTLRPRRADIELGGRACFVAQVFDSAGCAIDAAPVVWSLDHGKAIKARLENGCLIAGDSSAESEGVFTVMARFGGVRSTAEVAVSAASLPSLLAKRLQARAIEGVQPTEAEAPGLHAAQTPPPSPQSHVAVSVSAVSQAQEGGRWLSLGAAALAVLGAGLLLLRRGHARPRKDTTPTSPQPRTQRCPTCSAEYPEGHAFCGNDGSPLLPPR
jgi:hypothetical protein